MTDSIEAVVARAASGLTEGGEHDSDSISSFISNSSGSSGYYSLSNDEENTNDAPVAIDKHEIVDVPKIAVDEYAVVADYGTAANLPETNVDAFASPTKSPLRRTKTRSIEVPSPKRSSMNRCERSSDSMLEDALVADKLKRRLASRRLSQVTNRRTIEYTGLSDFIMQSIMEGGSLDAISAVLPTNESLSNVANTAYHACMSGYFSNLCHDFNRRLTLITICLSLMTVELAVVLFGQLIIVDLIEAISYVAKCWCNSLSNSAVSGDNDVVITPPSKASTVVGTCAFIIAFMDTPE